MEKNKAQKRDRVCKALLKMWFWTKAWEREREEPAMQLPAVRAMWIERHMQSRKWKCAWWIWGISVEGTAQSKCGGDGRKVRGKAGGHITWALSGHSKDSAATPDETGALRGCEQRRWYFFFLNRISLIEGVRGRNGDIVFGPKQEWPLPWAPCFRGFCIKQTHSM